MVIVYILERFPSYSEYFILNEITALREQGFRIIVASVKKGPPLNDRSSSSTEPTLYFGSWFSPVKSVAHLYLLRKHGPRYWSVLREAVLAGGSVADSLRRWKHFSIAAYFLFRLRQIPVDRLHAHFLSLPSTIALIMSKLSGIEFSCSAHAHDIFTTGEPELAKKIAAAKLVITCTRFNLEYLKAIAPEAKERIHQVYHGIDLSKWQGRKGFHPFTNGIHILSVGRLVEKKGTIYLLQAVKQLKASYEIRCSIVGGGPLLPVLKDFIRQNQLEENVHLYGALEQEKIKPLYEAADLFVLPCRETADGDRDGLPNVLMEALAVGVPVISTPVSAVPELVENRVTGLLVPQEDATAIAEAIMRLRNDTALYQYIVANGWEKIKKFDIHHSTNRLSQLLEGT